MRQNVAKFLIFALVAALVFGGLLATTAQAQDNPVLRVFLGSVGQVDFDKEQMDRWGAENNVTVEIVQGPQSATDYLAQLQQLFAAKSTDIDLIQFDVIWPGILAPNMADLGPAATDAGLLDQFFPRIVTNNTVDGKLVGLPWFTDAGLLFYRTDLLEKYGYDAAPTTWDELQEMAVKIQEGERAEGNAEFWGFVWQGNAYEGLTCDALEWQFANGGGSIVENDKTISVNNPKAIEAIERAATWVGNFSPEGVTTLPGRGSAPRLPGGQCGLHAQLALCLYARPGRWRLRNGHQGQVCRDGSARRRCGARRLAARRERLQRECRPRHPACSLDDQP